MHDHSVQFNEKTVPYLKLGRIEDYSCGRVEVAEGFRDGRSILSYLRQHYFDRLNSQHTFYRDNGAYHEEHPDLVWPVNIGLCCEICGRPPENITGNILFDFPPRKRKFDEKIICLFCSDCAELAHVWRPMYGRHLKSKLLYPPSQPLVDGRKYNEGIALEYKIHLQDGTKLYSRTAYELGYAYSLATGRSGYLAAECQGRNGQDFLISYYKWSRNSTKKELVNGAYCHALPVEVSEKHSSTN